MPKLLSVFLLCLTFSCAAHQSFPSRDLVSRLSPSTVIFTNAEQSGWGSGVVLRSGEKGSTLVTASHVIANATRILWRGKSIPFTVIANYPDRDIAFVLVKENLGINTKVRYQSVYPGMRILALGFPSLGAEKLTLSVTEGVIASVVRKRGQPWYRISASIYYGSSGGPIFDEDGALVCVASHMRQLYRIPIQDNFYCAPVVPDK